MEADLLIATSSPDKIREILLTLGDVPCRLRTLPDLGSLPAPEETGRTFAENARLKARYYAQATGLPAVAEDSGLVVDALGGRPGIHSARYPGDTYPEKFRRLYAELAGHPRPWTARYVCALAVVSPADEPALRFEAEATVEGEIAAAPAGTHGFGYDPIFYYPPFGATLAEVDEARKLAVAHRGQAFRRLGAFLAER
jgi:XTP/dITP diphosphohydrolase